MVRFRTNSKPVSEQYEAPDKIVNTWHSMPRDRDLAGPEPFFRPRIWLARRTLTAAGPAPVIHLLKKLKCIYLQVSKNPDIVSDVSYKACNITMQFFCIITGYVEMTKSCKF